MAGTRAVRLPLEASDFLCFLSLLSEQRHEIQGETLTRVKLCMAFINLDWPPSSWLASSSWNCNPGLFWKWSSPGCYTSIPFVRALLKSSHSFSYVPICSCVFVRNHFYRPIWDIDCYNAFDKKTFHCVWSIGQLLPLSWHARIHFPRCAILYKV